ncbi:MAG: hypothetical protein LBC64_09520 [Fibromonadaceae bacterium]|jgi:hypothetical protein|nr:hypothetical protein [Fibromonadaceae bacterium]
MTTKTIPKLSLKTLKACSNRASLEREFKRHNIPVERRISFLKKAMGNPVMSYTSGYPSVEDRYEVAIGAYLSGVWKRDYSSFSAIENKNAS